MGQTEEVTTAKGTKRKRRGMRIRGERLLRDSRAKGRSGKEKNLSERERQQLVELFRDGRFLEAAEVLSERGGESPDYRNLHNQAAAYYKAGRFARAAECAQGALKEQPQAARTHYLLGLIQRDAGHLEEAVRALDLACQGDPDSTKAPYARAIARFLLGQAEPAIAEMKAALKKQPEDSLGQFNLGVMLVSKGKWHEAAGAFVRAMRLDPSTCEEYARFLVDIGRAQAYEEVYGQGHRLKNMVGVLGDRLRALAANVSSRMSPRERAEFGEVGDKLNAVFADLNNFLNTAGNRQLELDLVDLREVVEQVLVGCSANLKGVKVRRSFAKELPEVVCDSAGIREAVLNLILNAIEAMPEGGELTLGLTAEGEQVALDVRDTGVGVPENMREAAFRFGFSTKPFGSGLGLSQASRTVERHGGTIALEANEPKGTTVRMKLPVSPRVESGIEDLAIRPVLSEDLRDLLIETKEGEGLLLV